MATSFRILKCTVFVSTAGGNNPYPGPGAAEDRDQGADGHTPSAQAGDCDSHPGESHHGLSGQQPAGHSHPAPAWTAAVHLAEPRRASHTAAPAAARSRGHVKRGSGAAQAARPDTHQRLARAPTRTQSHSSGRVYAHGHCCSHSHSHRHNPSRYPN